MAWPITWPPNTRRQLVFGLLPRNKFTSSCSRSRMASRSIRLLDINDAFDAAQGGKIDTAALFGEPVSPSYTPGARVRVRKAFHVGTAKHCDLWRGICRTGAGA